ncbi:hypothetical protein [Azospirillum rugosum]|uniref:Uncharacterized protein n=1 Tax=Azospirillum rugosum TaxID=416170 RepID=A0ABS4SR03_9PROT|nr:hypothetical protein [Azospirillum rugosum]MBP2295008.1 hypothetical protein [Azospirillum rugosum]MDQ0528831.1 hypothetical protein [Azospirillum rugosum]
MERHGFPATFAGMMSAFLIWVVHFLAIYGINGLVCARGLDALDLFGLPLPVALVLGATAAALLLAGAVLMGALWSGGPAPRASDDPRRFIRWFTATAAVAALVAILWNGLPALQVPACG